jgi:hypothetical protein
MVSAYVFRQRGLTLLYRTFNLMIQSVLYGKFRIVISTLIKLIHAQEFMHHSYQFQHI